MPTNQIINDVLPWTQASASNLQTVFDTNWTAAYPYDVVVFQRGMDEEPNEALQVLLDSQYVVTFVGTQQVVRVTLLTPAVAGDIITITRNTAVDRLNLYTNTNFVPSMLNQDTALLTFVDQERAMLNNMSVKYHISGLNPNLGAINNPPVVPLGPNQIWAMNPDGDAIIAYDVPEGGGIATDKAKFILQEPHLGLPNAQAMSELPTGLVVSNNGSGVQVTRVLEGVTNQIQILNAAGLADNPIIGISENPIIPGTAGMGVPQGTTAQRVEPLTGIGLRFNTDINTLEAFINGTWQMIPSSSSGSYLPLAGGTMVGNINLNGFGLLNALLGTNLNANAFNITDLATPINPLDAANKAYVDAIAGGRYFTAPVRVSATGNLASTYNNGAAGVGATLTASANGVAVLDGVTLALNDRVLFPFQTTAQQNGVYIVTNLGSVSAQAVYTRASDYDTPGEIDPGDTVGVTQGTVYSGAFFMQTAAVATIGTNPITFILSVNPNVVTLNTAQTITGAKTFTAPMTANNFVFNGNQMQHLGDLDNYFEFGTDTQNFVTGNSSRMDLTNAGLRLGGANSRVTTILNDGALSPNSATALPTQQAVKTYVDSFVGGGHFSTNFVIGGKFATNPWQRGTSFSNAQSGNYNADRWLLVGTNSAVINVTRAAGGPPISISGMYSPVCLRYAVGTADTNITAAKSGYFKTIIEGYDFVQFAQQVVTLSFYCRALKTGTYCVAVSNGAENATPPPSVFPDYQSCVFEYQVTTSGVWQKVTITIPATPSTGIWQYGIGRGYQIYFMQAAGTDFQTSNTGVWQAHPGAGVYLATPNQVNNLDAAGNYFEIDQVQLELGSVATAFEARSFQNELEMCQRYFVKSFNQGVTPASATGLDGAIKYAAANTGVIAAGCYIQFPTPMRIAAPAATFYNPQAAGSNWRNISGTPANSGTSSAINPGSTGMFVRNPQVAADAPGNIIAIHYTADAEL